MKLTAAPVVLSLLLVSGNFLFAADDVSVSWLDKGAPASASGVSFGVPWPKGAVQKTQVFSLTGADGKSLPLQTWPLAYWPDGSLKWSGFATVAGTDTGTAFTLKTSAAATEPVGVKVTVRETDTAIEIDTGKVVARLARSGTNLIESLSVDGREVARQGRLTGIVQNAPDGEPDAPPAREKFQSKVEKVTVEQSGPVRAVVKIEGRHRLLQSGREWLPFSLRLYFYAGREAIRVVHTFIFDGDQEKDFIRGLGLVFSVPLREQSQNRHVRFSGSDGGLWSEPIQPGAGNAAQQAGQRIEANQPTGFGGRNYYAPNAEQQYAIWSDYKLEQLSPDGFTIFKRTNAQSSWVFAGAGKRASGLAFVGDVTGGLAISVKNFWQSYPSALEIRGAAEGSAQLTAWLWSPEAPAMDLWDPLESTCRHASLSIL